MQVAKWIGTAGAAALFAVSATACAKSPMAPSVPASAPGPSIEVPAATLTVRVLARNSQLPIAGAQIATPTLTASTDVDGMCSFTVHAGEAVDVDVSAAGYESMGASGVLGSSERWTFYLPPLGE
jgi:hypothetical protein